MKNLKIKKILLSSLFLVFPLHNTAIFANEFLKVNNEFSLIAEARGYREHEDKSEDEDDIIQFITIGKITII